MAGHSQFKNIMYRKGAQDKKRASLFAKLARELTVSAKLGGADPDANPRLRAAMAAARNSNMPKDNVERAIRKGAGGGEGEEYEEIRYEGYAPGGVAVLIEALTDNRNRTASEIRAAFSKHGGNLGESGAVSFMFDRVGEIRFKSDAGSAEAMFEAALEAGAADVESDASGHVVTCEAEDLNSVAGALERRFGEPDSTRLVWRPQTTVPVDEEVAGKVFKLLETLDDNDDVQSIAANYEIDDDILARLTA